MLLTRGAILALAALASAGVAVPQLFSESGIGSAYDFGFSLCICGLF